MTTERQEPATPEYNHNEHDKTSEDDRQNRTRRPLGFVALAASGLNAVVGAVELAAYKTASMLSDGLHNLLSDAVAYGLEAYNLLRGRPEPPADFDRHDYHDHGHTNEPSVVPSIAEPKFRDESNHDPHRLAGRDLLRQKIAYSAIWATAAWATVDGTRQAITGGEEIPDDFALPAAATSLGMNLALMSAAYAVLRRHQGGRQNRQSQTNSVNDNHSWCDQYDPNPSHQNHHNHHAKRNFIRHAAYDSVTAIGAVASTWLLSRGYFLPGHVTTAVVGAAGMRLFLPTDRNLHGHSLFSGEHNHS